MVDSGIAVLWAEGITKRCRLSWVENSAIVYEPKWGGGGGCCNEYNCAHGAQINFRSNSIVKGSRQQESRGVGSVSNCPNLCRTAVIDVLFPINFAVVFDFTYFRFRPSKAVKRKICLIFMCSTRYSWSWLKISLIFYICAASVADPWHFGVDPDPDPRIHASD